MTRIAVIAAMPGELKPLTRGWRHQRRNGVDLWRWRFDQGEWIAACAGAGVDRAAKAFAEAEKSGPITTVISTGWAGALREELVVGRAFWVAGVIDARTGERFEAADMRSHPSRKNNDAARVGHPADDSRDSYSRSQNRDLGHPELWLVTSSRVADAAEKRRLASTYSAALVDMEAAGLARLAQMRGIPFYCIKGISDGYSDQLPDFNRFISPGGQFKLAPFVLFALLRPWYWHALIRMGENSREAARNIAQSVLDFLDEPG
jgi:adenosylhomocysteine nucleosidase